MPERILVIDDVERPGRRGGRGIRAAIVRQVVRAHGGLVWLDSAPGPGCIFSFTLPAVEDAER